MVAVQGIELTAYQPILVTLFGINFLLIPLKIPPYSNIQVKNRLATTKQRKRADRVENNQG